MTTKTPAKIWNKPSLVRLGTIEDVAGATAGAKSNNTTKSRS